MRRVRFSHGSRPAEGYAVTTAVIGSGIAGLSVAFELMRRGRGVVLVDADHAGRATDAGAGIISGIGTRRTTENVLEFSMRSAEHYVKLVHDLATKGRDTSFYRTAGEFLIALDDSEAARLEDLHAWVSTAVGTYGSVGVGVPQMLDRAETTRRFPLFSPRAQGVLLPDVGQIDGRALRRLLLDEIRSAGSDVVAGRAELGQSSDGMVTVTVDGRTVTADDVVVAAGAWSSELLSAIVEPGFVGPQRGQIMHLRLSGATAHPSANGFRSYYLLSFANDRLVVGATRENDSGFDARTTTSGLEAVLAAGRDMVPTIDDAELVEVRVGIRPHSADGLPIVGRVPGVPNLWVATGYGPQGLTLGTFIGHELAAEMVGGTSAIPATFRPDRLTPRMDPREPPKPHSGSSPKAG
ncbi:MAG TPA: FAD-dependent oxidoreductase [Micromonosporaceae bacterium]|nr:FAD-dependent oxidoreductase [Micromonosporaceae bacterium]